VEIHPFNDGNGRTARLLMNLINSYLSRWKGIDLPARHARFRFVQAFASVAIFLRLWRYSKREEPTHGSAFQPRRTGKA
jgi:prophage maintenance system killer protein